MGLTVNVWSCLVGECRTGFHGGEWEVGRKRSLRDVELPGDAASLGLGEEQAGEPRVMLKRLDAEAELPAVLALDEEGGAVLHRRSSCRG